mgnify:FL=1
MKKKYKQIAMTQKSLKTKTYSKLVKKKKKKMKPVARKY